MKKLLLILLLAATASAQQIDGRVTLEWDYPTNQVADTTFKIYHSPTLVQPLASWAVIASTNGATRLPLIVIPGENYFVCTASNFWGESDFSAVASTPALPLSDINLRIRRGH